MIRKNLYILAFLLLSITAQAQTRLTIDQCREMALENSYKLKSSREQILVSEDMLAAYKTNNLPNLSLSANYLYSTTSFSETITGGYLPTYVPDATGTLVPNIASVGADGTVIFNEYAYMPDMNFDIEIGSVFSGGAMVTQPIYMGGKISTAIKLAKVGVEASKLEDKKSKAEVLESLDKAFYTMIQVQEMVLSAHKYQQVVEEFLRQITSGFNNGMVSRNDLLKVEVRLNEAKLMSQKAENGLRLSRMNLCYLLGYSLSRGDFELEDQQLEPYAIDNIDLDITSRPEYAMLEQQTLAKELEIKLTRSEFLPSVTAVGYYGYSNGATINSSPLLNSAAFSGGVSVSVPIFHWGEGRRKVSAKTRELNMARNQMSDLSLQMSLELLQSINNYNESLLEVELTRGATLQAEENMRVSKSHYDAGLETIADYLESQALWQQAMSSHIEARAGQRISYTSYQRCSGQLVY